jgi:tripartite-type tricarboxylate transporter receptor subunit TctC
MAFVARRGLSVLCAALVLLACGIAQGQTFPSGPIRLVVAYPTGGPSDVVARLLAERMATRLTVPVLVENRGGAGGSVAIDALARSAPDGQTLVFSSISPLTLNPHLGKLGYDPFNDIVPVTGVMVAPVFVLATPALAARDFNDMLVLAKAKPGTVRWATSGIATVGHLMLEQVKAKAGVDILHVPYKGGGQAVTDAIGGQFELYTANPGPAVNAQVQAGRLRLLAVAAPQRLTDFPAVPTLTELGQPAANLMSIFGLFAPRRTPEPVVRRIHAEVVDALARPEVRERIVKLDNMPAPLAPDVFARLIRSEYDNNGRIVRDAGIRAE